MCNPTSLRYPCSLLGSFVALFLLGSPRAFAQGLKLNDPLPQGGDVVAFEVAGDGRHVLYVADQDADQVFELFSVGTGVHASPVQVSGNLVAGGNVNNHNAYWDVSPDGTRALYVADQDTNDVNELYSAPIDGGAAPVKLNGALPAQGDVTLFIIDANSARVVYRADQNGDEQYELFSAPIDGSAAPVRLNAPMVTGGDHYNFAIAPNGARVVYLADQDVDEQYELYSVPIDGSAAPVKLNGALPTGGDVIIYRIRSDSGALVYSARQEAADRTDVYVVPADGSAAAVRVSASPANTAIREPLFTPDGLRVLYHASEPSYTLLMVPADASQPALQLSGAGEGVLYGDRGFQFSADGQRVLYVATVSSKPHLFVVPVDGSASSVQLSSSGQEVLAPGFSPNYLLSPAGRAIFKAYHTPGSYGLYSVPIDGSATPLRLDLVGMRPSGGELTQDGLRVVFNGRLEGVIGSRSELFSVPIDGSRTPVLLASDPHQDIGGMGFALVPTGDRVAFLLGDLFDNRKVELFLTLLDRDRVPPGRIR